MTASGLVYVQLTSYAQGKYSQEEKSFSKVPCTSLQFNKIWTTGIALLLNGSLAHGSQEH